MFWFFKEPKTLEDAEKLIREGFEAFNGREPTEDDLEIMTEHFRSEVAGLILGGPPPKSIS